MVWGALVIVVVAAVALGVHSLRRSVYVARTSEARELLARIGSAAAAAYARDGRFCPSATAPVPRTLSAEWQARCSPPDDGRYHGDAFHTSSRADWLADPDGQGFRCLGWEMSQPQHYQYDYTATATSFTARARACREDMGSFAITGHIEQGRVIVGEIAEVDWRVELGR